MKNSTKTRKKKLLALLLSAMTVLSIASLASCKDQGGNVSSSDSSTEEETTDTPITDKGLIKNAGFEVFNTNDGLNVIGTTVSNWSLSKYSDGTNQAPKSYADSGILDTSDDAWHDLTGSYYVKDGIVTNLEEADKKIEALSESEAIAEWDNFTTRDKLKYYEVWKDNNKDGKISEDFDKYENFNNGGLALVDVPDIANPGTHHSADEVAKEDFSDYNVLMIRNKNPETDEGEKVIQSIGSAQKYTSSSTVTVGAGAAAEISVWVKTQDLMCSSSDGEAQEAVDKGAYISLAQTVGGTVMPVYEVKNINTKYMDLEDTNGWKQYTFYVKGSSYTTTTLTLTLGLGQGTEKSRMELVNGYAFFDDIQCNVFPQADVDGKLSNHTNVAPTSTFEDTKALKTIDLSKDYDQSTSIAEAEDLGYLAGKGFDVFPIDFYGEFTNTEEVLNSVTAYPTKSDDGKTSMAGDKDGNVTLPTLEGGRNGDDDLINVFNDIASIGAFTSSNATQQEFVSSIYNKYFDGVNSPNLNGQNGKVLLIMSAHGVAYTAKSNHAFSFKDDNGVYSDYVAVSFFVRTSNMYGYTGAGVTLLDGENEFSFSSIDTTNNTPVNIGEEEDVYSGWQQYIFFVKNDTDNEDATFQLQFNFGPTTLDQNSVLNSFQTGFAAFTNFQTLHMTEEEFESVNAGTYMKTVTLSGDKEVTAAGNSGFDTAAGNKSALYQDGIEGGLSLLQNYKGVYSNSDYVTDQFQNKTAINAYESAGLLNRNYFIGTAEEPGYYDEYKALEFDGDDTTNAPEWFKSILKIANADASTSAADAWKAVFGDATQPLFIWNDGAKGDGTEDENTKDKNYSYGFIGANTTIAANSTATAISVRVKVGSTDTNAAAPTANVYLIDTSTDSRANSLSIGASATYWYDSKGNVYAGDLETEKYPALLLQNNGLYIANTKWKGYDAETMNGQYYANLNAYTDKDANGNLLVAANGGVHDYVTASEYVKVKGEKRAIAFYHDNGKYYADSAKSIEVAQFPASIAPRTESVADKALQATIPATGDWVTVTFYVQTGEEAKSYRLEVWSGDRKGETPNAAGTYVMFDGNPSASTDAETTYNSLLTAYEDEADQYKSVFSYYDTDKFLRYNKSLDVNAKGNAYRNYDATTAEEKVFYLHATDAKNNQDFLINYAAQDQVVTAVADDTDNSTPDNSTSNTDNATPTNPWLLASSIAIAVILLLAIVSIIVRKVWKKARKNNAKKPSKQKKSKSKSVKVETVKTEEPKEEIDEDSPYND
ncbi:MAG: hypothetical protein E7352_06070 [Clostridiales bacterium]|nr:hypothetical protein [Clostridiales bacterium]